jgi:hypothetical protein
MCPVGKIRRAPSRWQQLGRGEIGTQRATVWEVHPVTLIEVSDGNGGWKDIEQNH